MKSRLPAICLLVLAITIAGVVVVAAPRGLAAGTVLGLSDASLPADARSADVCPAPPPAGTGCAGRAAAADAGTVKVSAKVEAVRLIVVGADGVISAIYSNTGPACDGEPGAYVLHVRSLTTVGPSLTPIPTGVMEEYRELLPGIDWSVRGLVYSAAR